MKFRTENFKNEYAIAIKEIEALENTNSYINLAIDKLNISIQLLNISLNTAEV